MTERERRERWDRTYRAVPERDADFETLSGEPLKPLYTPADLPDFDVDERLGYPGAYPFGRGVYPSMYRGQIGRAHV